MKTRKLEQYCRLVSRLQSMCFSYEEAATLRRIEMTLHRWAEHECNGTIQRDGENSDGKPRHYYTIGNGDIIPGVVANDLERGALKRLSTIMEEHPDYIAYHQGDPRGCALYIVPKAELARTGLPVDAIYSSGIAVCT